MNAAANDEMAEELVTTARRRLMDWMVINNSPVQIIGWFPQNIIVK